MLPEHISRRSEMIPVSLRGDPQSPMPTQLSTVKEEAHHRKMQIASAAIDHATKLPPAAEALNSVSVSTLW